MAELSNGTPVHEMPPQEWLKYTRKKHFPEKPFIVAESQIEEFISHLPESERKRSRRVWVNRQGTSVYEVIDELMQTYLEQIQPVLRPEENEVVQDTLFAVLPTFEFNGYVGLTPRGDRVVILHWGLGMTLNFWSHWYLRLFEEGNDYVTEHPERLYHTLQYFFNFWFGIDPGPSFPDIYPKTKDSWELDEAMTLGAISFVLGHEIGHVLHKHRPYGPNQNQNHAMEYEADRTGLEIVIRHALLKTVVSKKDNYFTKFILFGPLFAFAVMSLFGDKASLTHPSPSLRKEGLLKSYKSVLKGLLKDHYDSIVSEIDDDLITLLRHNVDNLFLMISTFRETIDEISNTLLPLDSSWVANEIQLK